MITDGFDFIAVMFGLCAGFVLLERYLQWRLFKWFPSIVLVMFGSMALYTIGAWEMTDEIRAARATVRDNLIPAMLFLMSLRFNLGVMRKLGPRLIVLSVVSTLTVMVGFVVVHQIMHPYLGDETPLTFATMSAGWTGGTQNFVAVKEALSVTDAAMTYTLLMGALCYSIWLVLIIASAGWIFDVYEGQIFNLTRNQLLQDILGVGADHPDTLTGQVGLECWI